MGLVNQAIANGSALLTSGPAAGTGAASNGTPTLLATGTYVANGSTGVVVADAGTTANSAIIITLMTVGGTPAGAPFLSSITPGTGYTIKSAGGDTSTYSLLRIG